MKAAHLAQPARHPPAASEVSVGLRKTSRCDQSTVIRLEWKPPPVRDRARLGREASSCSPPVVVAGAILQASLRLHCWSDQSSTPWERKRVSLPFSRR